MCKVIALVEAVLSPQISGRPPEKSGMPVWDAEQLRLATLTAAGVALWSWNVDTQSIHDGRESFPPLGRANSADP